MSGEKIIRIKKSDLWKYSMFVLITAVVILTLFAFTGNSSETNPAQISTNPTQQTEKVIVSIDDDAVLGNEDAPVTIIEFSDYQCPFCRKFWAETLPLIKSEYIDTGKVKFVYRDFPSTGHPMATISAEAVECVRDIAGNDKAYFEYHDKLFEEQNILDSGSPKGPVRGVVTYTSNNLRDWAQELGYDINSCLDSGKFKSEVQKDLADGQSAGGTGTPYFIINGNPLSGVYPFSTFQQVIEAELT